MKKLHQIMTICIIILFSLNACTAGQGGYYNPYPDNYSPHYDRYPYDKDLNRDYHYDRERRRLEQEQDRAQYERERMEAERRRLEAERQHAEQSRPTKTSVVGRCPAGWKAGHSKCTPKQRKQGCKDMRLPSGKLCISH